MSTLTAASFTRRKLDTSQYQYVGKVSGNRDSRARLRLDGADRVVSGIRIYDDRFQFCRCSEPDSSLVTTAVDSCSMGTRFCDHFEACCIHPSFRTAHDARAHRPIAACVRAGCVEVCDSEFGVGETRMQRSERGVSRHVASLLCCE